MSGTLKGFVAAAVMAIAACGGNGPAEPPPAESIAVELGREFELRMNQTAVVDGVQLTLRAVPEDSRCPIDAICVWEGNARAVLEVRTLTGSDVNTVSLNTTLEPREVVSHGHRVRLIGVLPAAESTVVIRQDQYRALLVVERG